MMVPGRMEGRDIVATTGRDGTVRIVDMFTYSEERGGVISTLKLNELKGTWGVKVVKSHIHQTKDSKTRRHSIKSTTRN